MTKGKMLAIPVLFIMCLSLLGIAYACWSETLYLNGSVQTGELDWEFIQPFTCYDTPGTKDWNGNCSWKMWQTDKDVGGPTTVVPSDTDDDGDWDTLTVTLNNTYPWYLEDIGFWVHNDGTIPLHFENVTINGQLVGSGQTIFLDLTGDGKNDVMIKYGDNIGQQLHPCGEREISFLILVLQDAPEGATLTFTMKLLAVQYNESIWPITRPS
jgi:hypothetical protein